MHSSRMRTGRSLTVCCSLLPGGRGGSAWSRGGSPCRGWGGVCLVPGEVLPGGGCLPGPGGSPCWGDLPGSGGFSLPGGCLPGPRGVSAWSRRVSAWSPGGPARRPPSVNRITDTCKNITLAILASLRPVIMHSRLLPRMALFLRNFKPSVFNCYL